MADQQLDILIRFGLDAKAAQQAVGELNKLKSGTEEAGKGAESFNVKGREMRKLMGELNQIAPGLGNTLRLMFSPTAIGIGAALALIHQLIAKYKELTDAAEKARQETAAVTVAVWQAARDGAQNAAKSAEAYIKAIANAGGALDQLKTKEDLEKTILGERIAQWERLLELMGKPKPAATIMDAIKLGLLRQQTERRQQEQPGLEQDAFEAERRKQAALTDNTAAARAKTELDSLQSKQQKLVADMQAARDANVLVNAGLGGKTIEELMRYVREKATAQGISIGAYMQGDIGQAIGRYQQAAGLVSQNQAAIAEREGVVSAYDARVRQATEAADAAARRRDTNRTAIFSDLDTIAKSEGVLREKESGERFGRLFGQGGAAERMQDILGAGQEALRARMTGKTISNEQMSAIQSLSNFLRDLGWGNNAIRQALQALIGTQREQNNYVQAMQRQTEELRRQIQQPRT